ncbi:outer membrane beta-barrel protein [Epilithonimonas hungarica]|uniref:Outer membrane receptor proteins, mostly Fe transport n=1 Tax=Epilithonimonas hungarica TaxID=454006 RepID=A0A1G7M8C7_9FLAO|nr:outer membrane beta-barrel protein [Epilithonimonas hungarica]SDF57876.1 Outer membrane receptor proteins, mostly Fe transport [Epilithonimonas hungarica]
MKQALSLLGLLSFAITFAQTQDTLKSKEIEAVTVIAKKPTVQSKADRTVFNVENSSILAGNTTWDIVRMTPLVSIDNNDNVKAEGESVTVYINDRKSVFTGKELKEYLKTIPADNLMKIEVITSPSSRYEATGAVINIVLKKRDDEGMKGSISLTNTQNTKNNQYGSLNLNYHKKNFTQTFTGSYNDNVFITKNSSEFSYYANKNRELIDSKSTYINKNPSFSSSSEYELNDKNNIGLVMEYFRGDNNSGTDSFIRSYDDNNFKKIDYQKLSGSNLNNTLGTNFFYKYYDKEKNKILDVNLGVNYETSEGSTGRTLKSTTSSPANIDGWNNISATEQTLINSDTQNRNYYVKVDFTTPLGKGGTLEVGGKADFNNNVIPNAYLDLMDGTKNVNSDFHYTDNINSLYFNYSKTFFEKLETRVGLRYEHIDFKIRENVGNQGRKDSYGTFLPNLLIKYSFSTNYDLSLTYNHNLWRPWFSEFNPFEMPSNNGIYYRGNMELLPNPSDRVVLKFGLFKKYFISARYMFTDQDYWTNYKEEDGKTISFPDNFKGKVEKFYLFANTNQNFLKNKLNVNFGLGWYYIDNSDFNIRNRLSRDNNYISYIGGSTNLSYTNLFNKNINISGWFSVDNQNYGNSVANKYNFFHNISVTKIFPDSQIETSLQLMNIFKRPSVDNTTYSSTGMIRNYNKWDWYGFSLTFVKRFGNQKVKENTKTDVEKNSGGGK